MEQRRKSNQEDSQKNIQLQPKKLDNLSIIFWNIEGLKKKMNLDLTNFIKKFSIIALYETWVESSNGIEGYRKFEKSAQKMGGFKKGRRAGGLVVFIKSCIKNVKMIKNKMNEVLWLRMNFASITILIGVVYRQPDQSVYFNANFFQQFLDEIEEMRIQFPKAEFIIGGDFNSRVGIETEQVDLNTEYDIFSRGLKTNLTDRKCKDTVQNNSGKKLLNVCKSCDLIIGNGRTKGDRLGEFTFVTQQGKSCIDLVLISPSLLSCTEFDLVVGERVESSHFPIITKLTIVNNTMQPDKSSRKLIRYRWKEERKEEFQLRIKNDRYKHLKNKISSKTKRENIHYAVERINRLMDYLGEGMKVKGLRKDNDCWFDVECQRKKEEVKRKLRRFRKDTLGLEEYFDSKKQYRKLCVEKKEEFKKKKLEDIMIAVKEKREKDFWTLIKIRGNRERQIGNEILEKTWIDYYSSIFKKNEVESQLEVGVKVTEYNETLDSEINKTEIGWAIKKLRDNKACGIDGIPGEFFKQLTPDEEILEILENLFNLIYKEKVWPNAWDTGVICPIYKNKGDRDDPSNYRPITLLPVASKIFTKILGSRLQNWLNDNNKNSILQAGFRPKFATVDNLMVLDTIIQKTINKKRRKLYACFVDFQLAFDSINRNKLFHKLRKNGVSNNFVKMIESIYKNVKCCVKFGNDSVTESFNSTRGVRQGCQLSTILFNMYVEDLAECIGGNTHAPCIGKFDVPLLQYADDLVILSETPIGLTRALKQLDKFCSQWDLTVNTKKTKVIIFSNGNKVSKKFKWFSKGQEIEIVNRIKYLGVNIAHNGKWNQQIEEVINRGRKYITTIRSGVYRIGGNGTIDLMEKIFFSVIQPAMLYGCEVWGEGKKVEMIDSVIKSFAKELLGVSKGVPGEVALGELGWMKIKYIIKKRQMLYYYKLKSCAERKLQQEC